METKIIEGIKRVKTEKEHWIDIRNIELYNKLSNITEEDIKEIIERRKRGENIIDLDESFGEFLREDDKGEN